jgi:hypothetical protein
MSEIGPLSQLRFEALLYRRQPFAHAIIREIEWWTIQDESLIATITIDRYDKDYGFAVLGRDETGVFRAVRSLCNYETIEEARDTMRQAIDELSKDGTQEYPQEDNDGKKHEILSPCVASQKLHPHFIYLTEDDFQSGARGLIKELSYAFKDLDGNYKKDFQTTGFYGRLWELYLYAFFYESRFDIKDEAPVPDFTLQGPTGKIAVEAVTVNPTDGVKPPQPTTPEEELELNKDYMPVKWSSPLYSKLKMRYWQKETAAGTPLIFAIHDFHGPNSMSWSKPALSDYLFGIRCDEEGNDHPNNSHTYNGRTIPSGFFNLPDSENISAVIASSEATLSKFNRMGTIAGFHTRETHIIRTGALLDLETMKFLPFSHPIEEGKRTETWASGIWIYHNPNAKHPLDPDTFHDAMNVFLKEGQRMHLSSQKHHVIRSRTTVIRPEAG